eukprot:14817513-Heterocapsa_arctica.AAC.1
MPCFEIVQASGKRRPMDNGARFGQNEASGFHETIECCTAVQPAVQPRALMTQAQKQGRLAEPQAEDIETGGEDMPEAY